MNEVKRVLLLTIILYAIAVIFGIAALVKA